jgi:hypothetical protein
VCAGTIAAGFPGVIAYRGWSRMIHAFAAPLGRLWPLREAKVRHVKEGLLRPRRGGQ